MDTKHNVKLPAYTNPEHAFDVLNNLILEKYISASDIIKEATLHGNDKRRYSELVDRYYTPSKALQQKLDSKDWFHVYPAAFWAEKTLNNVELGEWNFCSKTSGNEVSLLDLEILRTCVLPKDTYRDFLFTIANKQQAFFNNTTN